MPQQDFISPAQSVTRTVTYDQKELYRFLRKWLSERHYLINEKEYTERVGPEGKRMFVFTWMADKKLDDYTKAVLEVSVRSITEDVKVELHDGKKKTAQKGDVSGSFRAFILKDYEDEWTLKKKPVPLRVLREMYDKMVLKGTFARHQAHLKKDYNALMSDFKTYLSTHKYD